jgi:hypothetical protein
MVTAVEAVAERILLITRFAQRRAVPAVELVAAAVKAAARANRAAARLDSSWSALIPR